jgi:hypothetical protein
VKAKDGAVLWGCKDSRTPQQPTEEIRRMNECVMWWNGETNKCKSAEKYEGRTIGD